MRDLTRMETAALRYARDRLYSDATGPFRMPMTREFVGHLTVLVDLADLDYLARFKYGAAAGGVRASRELSRKVTEHVRRERSREIAADVFGIRNPVIELHLTSEYGAYEDDPQHDAMVSNREDGWIPW